VIILIISLRVIRTPLKKTTPREQGCCGHRVSHRVRITSPETGEKRRGERKEEDSKGSNKFNRISHEGNKKRLIIQTACGKLEPEERKCRTSEN